MSNVALIFAGGTGQRMNTRTRPKQFLELHGKPIIVYTLEAFDQHSEIEGPNSFLNCTGNLSSSILLKLLTSTARSTASWS